MGKLQCEQAGKEALEQERDEALRQASATKEEMLRNQEEKEQLQAELDQGTRPGPARRTRKGLPGPPRPRVALQVATQRVNRRYDVVVSFCF